MSETDLKINSKVRKILTEYYIDLTHLTVSTASGSVTISGEIRKVTGHGIKESEIPKFLSVIESVVLRTKNVKRVTFAIRGWKKAKGKWEKTDDE